VQAGATGRSAKDGRPIPPRSHSGKVESAKPNLTQNSMNALAHRLLTGRPRRRHTTPRRLLLIWGTALATVLWAAAAMAHAQGSLTPPGAPAPSMKTLDQIEPRIPVNTLPGSSDAIHVITQPGHYYLTAGVVGQAGKHGILIKASRVRLDLNGFSVQGVTGSLDGVTRGPVGDGDASYEHVMVHNGTITNWGGHGIYLQDVRFPIVRDVTVQNVLNLGILLYEHAAVSDVRVISARQYGIYLYNGSVRHSNVSTVVSNVATHLAGIFMYHGTVEHCIVENIYTAAGLGATAHGIEVQVGAVSRCVVRAVSSHHKAIGISAPQVDHCHTSGVSANISSGMAIGIAVPDNTAASGLISHCEVSGIKAREAYGIAEGANPWIDRGNKESRVQHCLVEKIESTGLRAIGIVARHVADTTVANVTNSVANPTVGSADGIHSLSGTIERVSVRQTKHNGISIANGGSVRNSRVHRAGFNGASFAAGICMSNGGNVIEANEVAASPVGYQRDSGNNIVVRNISRDNVTPFKVGVTGTAPIISGQTALNAATNPFANLAF
jgi:hypothetical protein